MREIRRHILLMFMMCVASFGNAQNPGYNTSYSCHVDIFCVPDVCDQRRGVVIIFEEIDGVFVGIGTGFLINNARFDSRPYLLTAQHMVDKDSNGIISPFENERLQNLRFVFNYQYSYCPGTGTLLEPGTNEYVKGASLVAHATVSNAVGVTGPSDWVLVELSSRVPGEYNCYLNGFNATDAIPDKIRIIHHPQGDVKKYGYSSDHVDDKLRLWTLDEWHTGAIELGSSGAPWFNQDFKVVGIQSTAAIVDCGEKASAYASRIDFAWEESSEYEHQLKHWLGNGDITELGGWDPCVESHYFEFANDLHTSANVDPTISVPGSRSYDGVYTASNLIQTGNQTSIADQTKVEFYASKIVLQPGFSTGTGSVFIAAPEPCLGGCGNGKRLTNDSWETTHTDKNLGVDIEVYPNPTTGIIHVVVNEREEVRSVEIEVRDVYGKLIYSENSNKSQTIVDLANHPKGIYLITVHDGKNLITRKVIHQ